MKKAAIASIGALVALGVSGCGGSSGSSGPQSTPKAAAATYLTALATNNPTTICQYIHVDTTTSGSCVDLLSQALASSKADFSGTVHVGNSAQSGTQAIVVVVGTAEFLGQKLTNTNVNAGLPTSSVPFATAFGQDQDSQTAPDIGLTLVSGKWFVELM